MSDADLDSVLEGVVGNVITLFSKETEYDLVNDQSIRAVWLLRVPGDVTERNNDSFFLKLAGVKIVCNDE